MSAAEVLDEMIADLKRREAALDKLTNSLPIKFGDSGRTQFKSAGVRIAIDLLESRRKDLPTC